MAERYSCRLNIACNPGRTEDEHEASLVPSNCTVYAVRRNSGVLVVALAKIWMGHPMGMLDSLVAWIGSLARRLCSILALLRFGDVL